MAKSNVDKHGDEINPQKKTAWGKTSHHEKGEKRKSGGDYDGWILRLIDKIEDLQFSYDTQAWLDFAASKIVGKQGYELTPAQIEALDVKRDIVFEEIPAKLNIRPEYVTRFRGAGGKFVTSRVPEATPETTTRYRNLEKSYGQRTGTMVNKSKVNDEIERMKAERKWDK